MTDDQEINIAIAEACGWKQSTNPVPVGRTPAWLVPNTNPQDFVPYPPNYCTDLNAMHEAEKWLDEDSHEFNERWHYGLALKEIVLKRETMSVEADWWYSAHASARQRAEAFLRVKGLWK